MKASAAIGIGAVGVLGVAAAIGLVWWSTNLAGPGPSELDEVVTMVPPSSEPPPRPDGADRAQPPVADALPAPAPRPDPATLPEGQFSRPDLGPAFEGEVRSLQDLQGRYDAALATTIDLSSLPADAHPEDVEKALRDQLLQSTATVSAAADAHLAFATSAGRADAKVARGRAAELYEHLASAIEDAPVPGHLPQSELDLHRQMLDRMAEQRRRQAAALRSAH